MVVLATRSRPRRAPWPDWFRLGGHGFPGAYLDKGDTSLVGQVPPDQSSVTPTEYGEQARNPAFGGTLGIRDLTQGMGQRRLRHAPNGRCWYALNARTRSGRWIQGPALTSYTPATRDATTGVTRFFTIASKWFALNGRYCLDGGTDGTGWTVSKDFGSGKAAVDVIVVQGNYAGATRLALVAMGDSENAYSFDGTTWTQTTGGNAFKARAWAVDATTLFYATDANKLMEIDLDADILVVANHASATGRIGTYDQPITRMTVNGSGSLLICKQDDVYTLNSDGSVNRLFAERQFVPASTNGEPLSRWGNATYVTYGNATYKLSDDGGLTQVGPEMLHDNGGDVRGYLTAHHGTDFYLLAGLYNPNSGASYVMEYEGGVTQDAYGRAEPSWHGSVTPAFASKRITCVDVATAGAATGHKNAYLGFSDGTITKYQLAVTSDPSDDTAEAFSTDDGHVHLGQIYFYFPGERKALLHAIGEADNFGPSTYAQLSYRTDPNASYVALGTDFNAGERQLVYFPDASSGTLLDARVTLKNGASTTTPKLSGFSFGYMVRPIPQDVMTIAIPAGDGLRRRDGTPYRRGADETRDLVETMASVAAGVTFVDPDGASHQVAVSAPQRVVAYEVSTRKATTAYRVVLTEQRPDVDRGTLLRSETYTLAESEEFTLAQWEEI